jgi:short-chain fatty acids transporter
MGEIVQERESPLERMGARLSASVESWMPDPLIFALLLTIVTFLLVLFVMKPYTAMDAGTMTKWLLVDVWYKGFWGLLAFAMQMCLILVTGYAIAYHPWVYRGLRRIATIPSNTKSAAALTALVSMIAAWINWGLGLIVGAILARAIGIEFYRRGVPLHYPAIVAAGYAGLGLTWHWGLSASAPPAHKHTQSLPQGHLCAALWEGNNSSE